jgi:protein-L-isoaspartate(D-aspartate) O-methyltransferase
MVVVPNVILILPEYGNNYIFYLITMASFKNSTKLRQQMVLQQIKTRGVKDKKVLSAMTKVPRHLFVPRESQSYAYEDRPLCIGEGQTISQPYMVALMTECLELKGGEKVLEIGTGSGYQTAILCEMAEVVYTIERHAFLLKEAKKILDELGYTNYEAKIGDGTIGWGEYSPFNGIIVTAGAPDIPPKLAEQLAEGGRLVIPVGHHGFQTLFKITKKGEKLIRCSITGCTFVPLIGEQGW